MLHMSYFQNLNSLLFNPTICYDITYLQCFLSYFPAFYFTRLTNICFVLISHLLDKNVHTLVTATVFAVVVNTAIWYYC